MPTHPQPPIFNGMLITLSSSGKHRDWGPHYLPYHSYQN